MFANTALSQESLDKKMRRQQDEYKERLQTQRKRYKADTKSKPVYEAMPDSRDNTPPTTARKDTAIPEPASTT